MKRSVFACGASLFSMLCSYCIAYAVPETNAAAADLPEGEIRSFGDARLADTAMVQSASFSPDGKSFATCDRELDIWDLKTGLLKKQLARPKLKFLRCWYQADGKLLAYAQNFQVMPVMMVIDPTPDTDSTPCELPQQRAGWLLGQSTVTKRIVFGGHAISLIDASNGTVIKELGGRSMMTHAMQMMTAQAEFSVDGKRMLFIDADGRAILLDGLTGKAMDSPAIPAPRGAVMLADQQRIAVGGDQIKIYDCKLGKLTETLPADPGPKNMTVTGIPPLKCMSASPKDGLLAAITTDEPSRVLIWETSQHPVPPPRVISTNQPRATSLTWSPDGSMLAVSGGAGRIQIINCHDSTFLYPAPLIQSIDAVCVTSDGKLIVEADNHGEICTWELDTGKMRASRQLSKPDFGRTIRFLRVNPANDTLVAATENGNIEILDPQSLETRRLIGGESGVTTAAMSNDGQLIAQKSNKVIHIWNLTTGASLYRIAEPEQTQWDRFVISQNQCSLVAANAKGLQAYDLKTGRPGVFSAWADNYFGVTSLDFEPGGPWLVAGGFVGVAGYPSEHLLGQAERKPSWQISLQSTSDVSFSNAGEFVAAVGYLFQGEATSYGRPQAIILEPGHSQFVCSLSPNTGTINLARFVPHRPLIVTTSTHGVTTVWDLASQLNLSKDDAQSNEQLSKDLQDDSPARALRAGLVLLKRNQLPKVAVICEPLKLAPSASADVPQLISQLSAPKKTDREKAHKELESLGAAAIDQVQRALSAHPGGELEERLVDIAHVIGANDLNPGSKDAVAPASPIWDPEELRTRRMIQLLDWSPDPAAKSEMKRLNRSLPQTTTQPAH